MSAPSSTFTDSRPNSFLPDIIDDFQLEPLFPPTCAPGASDVAVNECGSDAVLTTKDLIVDGSALVSSKLVDEPLAANNEEEVDLTRENASLHDLTFNAAPDGGLSAILVVVASFLLNFSILGIQYSFGIYQKYLPNAEFKGRVTAAEVSLVGSVSFGVANLLGVYSGRLADVYGYRLMVLVGTVIMVVGLLLSAFSTELWHLMVTQGLLLGLGCSVAYFPGVAVNAQWWDKHRSLATGIAVAGAGAGGLAFANGTEVLLDTVGLKWTLLITALVTLVLQFVAMGLLKTRIPTRSRPLREALRNVIDWQLLKTRGFPPLIIGVFLNPFAYMIPFYFIPSYCQAQGLADTSGALLLSVINITSVVGRIVVGFLADRWGNVNCYLASTMFVAVSCLGIWLWAATMPGLVAFAAVFGFCAGGLISLMFSVTAQLFGTEGLATSIGLIYTTESVGHLVGPPLAALLIRNDSSLPSRGYAGLIVYAGVSSLVAAMCFAYMRFAVLDRAVWKKV
ncbi:hypothetical protein GGF31_002986 [Allomyces arbusculus]|nr:hypothetical protein GGF31_002986 [Allomyces arbusculus]